MSNINSVNLTAGAKFNGILEIPVIDKPFRAIIPDILVPFSERRKVKATNATVCFYEDDRKFSEILADPAKYIEDLARYQAVISPDFSMYRDAPLVEQILSLYRNQAIGSYWQRKGVNIIPNIRWGSEDTYTDSIFTEKVAFSSVEKYSIVAVGTYGCIKSREDKYHFRAGLGAMLEAITPETVLVYGAMPESVFKEYRYRTRFICYDNWIKSRHKRRCQIWEQE